jgi:hypothetical protein
MKAIVADRYGPPEVLEFREVDKQENDVVHLAEVPVRQLKSAVKRPLNGTRHGTHLRNGRRVTQERHAVDALSKNVIVAHHDFRAPLKIRRAWRLRRSRQLGSRNLRACGDQPPGRSAGLFDSLEHQKQRRPVPCFEAAQQLHTADPRPT